MASAIALKYYRLIVSGEKTIYDVPASKRAEVEELLSLTEPTETDNAPQMSSPQNSLLNQTRAATMPYNNYQGYPAYSGQSGTSDLQGVRWVASFDEVKAASVPFGRSLFMETGQDIFYIKDSNGSIKRFAFKETDLPVPENFVTRKEFDDLKEKYEQLVIQSTAATTAAQFNQSNANTASNEELQWNSGGSQEPVPATGIFNGTE